MTQEVDPAEDSARLHTESVVDGVLLEADARRIASLAMVEIGVRSTSPNYGIYETGALIAARLALTEQYRS